MLRTPPDEALVAGRWRRGGGAPAQTSDPATGRCLATVHAVTPEEVAEAARTDPAAHQAAASALPEA
ncbi:aldehyde dehydrogenase, partial [Streptomyces sp. NPDC006134]